MPEDDEQRDADESQHEVTLSDFYLAKTEVTNAQYKLYLDENPDVQKPKYWDDTSYNQAMLATRPPGSASVRATAREHVRVARALGELLLVDAAFAAAKLSYAKVRAITRVATPATEQDFIDVAMHATASQIEKIAAAYRRVRVDPSEPTMDLRRFLRRSDTRSGMVRIELQLPPEQANVVWEAMSAALETGRREKQDVSAETSDAAAGEGTAPSPGAIRVSAETSARGTTLEAERADALVNVAQGYLQHKPRTLGSSYELVIMTTKEQLEHGPGGVGGFLPDGTPIPSHVARMLACDCTRVDVEMSESGEILDVGRARRTVPSAIDRALWLRDGGCRVPGCGRRQHVQRHHIEAWVDGGKTAASNLVLLCSSHHTAVHEGKLSVRMHEGKLEFRNAWGLEIHGVPTRTENLDEVEHWLGTVESGLDPRGMPLWDGSRLELDVVVSAMLLSERWHGACPT